MILTKNLKHLTKSYNVIKKVIVYFNNRLIIKTLNLPPQKSEIMSTLSHNTDYTMIIRAIEIATNKILFEGFNGEEVISNAEKSGKDYILDFETHPGYNFIF